MDIVTLDEIIPRERMVSNIQLDVEGFEKQALTGALMTVNRCKPIIVLEQLPEESWFSKNIISLGYQIVAGELPQKHNPQRCVVPPNAASLCG